MKIGVFWDVTPCGSCKNRRFGGTSSGMLRRVAFVRTDVSGEPSSGMLHLVALIITDVSGERLQGSYVVRSYKSHKA
jgi:hypothetical protein